MAGSRNLDVRLRVRNQRAFNADMKKSERGIKSFATATGRADLRARAGARAMGGFSSALRMAGRAGLYAGGALAAGAAIGAKRSIEAASDLEESVNKANVTFGKARRGIIGWSEDAADALGFSQQAALENAGSVGAMLKPMGVAEGKAARMSRRMVRLAADMASFNNEDPSEMLERIRAGLTGESEPLKRFGTVLSETRVQQHAWKTGMVESGEELTEQEKIMARYSLLLKDTSDQHGDFANTSESLANLQRRLKANFTNTGAAIGKDLLPYARRGTQVLNELAGDIEAIFERGDLTLEDKLELSSDAARRNLAPLWRELERGVDRADIGGKLAKAVGDGIPIAAEAAGKGGGALAVAFAKGWWDADIGGKLFTLALLGGKLGAFAPLGRKAAGKFSSTFARKTGESLVAQQAVDSIMGSSIAGRKSRWGRLGSKGGRRFGKAFGAGVVLTAPLWLPEFAFAIKEKLQEEFPEIFGGKGQSEPSFIPNPNFEKGSKALEKTTGIPGAPFYAPTPPPVKFPPRRGRGSSRGARAGASSVAPRRVASDGALFQITVQSVLDGKVIADSTGRHTADRRARR